MRYENRLLLALCLLAAAPAVHAQMAPSLQGLFGKPRVIGFYADLAKPIGYDLFADGSVVVADYGRIDVTKLSADGKVVWRSGRKGLGPGEYLVPYRVVALRDNSVIVYEPGRGFTRLDSTGVYREQLRSEVEFYVDDIEGLPDGNIAVLGTTSDARGKQAVIHVLTPTLRYVRSFGRLPEVKDPRRLNSFGAGGISITPDGAILHTRFYPYEISKYHLDGTELYRLRPPLSVATPEEYVEIIENDGRVQRSINITRLRPIPARELGNGMLIGGRWKGQRGSFDLINARGEIVASSPMPDDWGGIIRIDFVRREFWLTGESYDVPVLLRIPFGRLMPSSVPATK